MGYGQEVDITDIQSAVEEIFPEDCPAYAWRHTMPLLPFHRWQWFTSTIAPGVYTLPYIDSGRKRPLFSDGGPWEGDSPPGHSLLQMGRRLIPRLLPPPDGKEIHFQAPPSSRWGNLERNLTLRQLPPLEHRPWEVDSFPGHSLLQSGKSGFQLIEHFFQHVSMSSDNC